MKSAKADYKQVIVLRQDLKMTKGKLAVQSAHASVSALDCANRGIVSLWKKDGQKKVVLGVKSLDELKELTKKCDELKIPYALITDAGLTEVNKGTVTALGIGPDEESKINKVTGSLPLLK